MMLQCACPWCASNHCSCFVCAPYPIWHLRYGSVLKITYWVRIRTQNHFLGTDPYRSPRSDFEYGSVPNMWFEYGSILNMWFWVQIRTHCDILGTRHNCYGGPAWICSLINGWMCCRMSACWTQIGGFPGLGRGHSWEVQTPTFLSLLQIALCCRNNADILISGVTMWSGNIAVNLAGSRHLR